MDSKVKSRSSPDSLLILREEEQSLEPVLGEPPEHHLEVCDGLRHLAEQFESGVSDCILLQLRSEETAVLDCLNLLQSLRLPATLFIVIPSESAPQSWELPSWIQLLEQPKKNAPVQSIYRNQSIGREEQRCQLRVGDLLALIEAGSLSLNLRIELGDHKELEVISYEGVIWSALAEDLLGAEALADNLFESVLSVTWRHQSRPVGQRWVNKNLREISSLREEDRPKPVRSQKSTNKVIPIRPDVTWRGERTNSRKEGAKLDRDRPENHQKDHKEESINITLKERIMANINETLAAAMEIEGAKGAALADFDSGMCLGSQGGGPDFDMEVAAAGNAEVVRSKHKVMEQLGLTDEIEDILISLGKEYHLIVPIAGQKLFLYVALKRANANLALARHKTRGLVASLSV